MVILFKYLPYLISTYLYVIALDGCYNTEPECLKNFPIEKVKNIFIGLAVSAFFIILQFTLFFSKFTSSRPIIFLLATFFYLCFIYDTGSNMGSHGGYNRIILFYFFLIWGLIISSIYFYAKLLFKFPKIVVLITVATIYSYFYFINYLFLNSCVNWDKGLKSSFLDNSLEKCKINSPKVCHYEVFNRFPLLDLSRLLRETCENLSDYKFHNIEKHVKDKNARVIGYPRTEDWDMFGKSAPDNFHKNVFDNLINMEDESIDKNIKDNIEVIVNFNKNPTELNINIKYNKTLSAERQELFNKSSPLAKNVILLFIDSISRPNFRLKLPKFYGWLEKNFYDFNLDKNLIKKENLNNDKNRKKQNQVFQFFRYHGVGRFTYFNMLPTFQGIFYTETTGKYFLQYYKNKGYVTGQSLNFCTREIYQTDLYSIQQNEITPFDHELQSVFCDPNYSEITNKYSILKGPNSMRLRCLYGKIGTYWGLEYLNKFFGSYKNNAKFFRLGIFEGHEGSGELLKYSDEMLYDFFIKFQKDGFLKDTLIIIQSDHGNAMMSPYMYTEQYTHDLVLPSFFLIVPEKLLENSQILKNLKINENRFFTPFTIYNTLLSVLNDKESIPISNHDLENLFDEISENRDCNTFFDLKYFMRNEYLCRCEK